MAVGCILGKDTFLHPEALSDGHRAIKVGKGLQDQRAQPETKHYLVN